MRYGHPPINILVTIPQLRPVLILPTLFLALRIQTQPLQDLVRYVHLNNIRYKQSHRAQRYRGHLTIPADCKSIHPVVMQQV